MEQRKQIITSVETLEKVLEICEKNGALKDVSFGYKVVSTPSGVPAVVAAQYRLRPLNVMSRMVLADPSFKDATGKPLLHRTAIIRFLKTGNFFKCDTYEAQNLEKFIYRVSLVLLVTYQGRSQPRCLSAYAESMRVCWKLIRYVFDEIDVVALLEDKEVTRQNFESFPFFSLALSFVKFSSSMPRILKSILNTPIFRSSAVMLAIHG